ncbi:MAG: DUF6782 family putative metallopeptidase [Micavibrio sp.]
MAKSHAPLFRSKTLCGAFLSAAMALTGCAHSPPPPPDQNNAEMATSSLDDKFLTGEELLDHPVRINDISKDGDPRMQRLIVELQRSSLGRELYQYMLDEKLSLQWGTGDDKHAGIYYHDKDLIGLDARHPDDGLLSILVHEIRHAWQYRKLGVIDWTLSPKDRWQASRLVEADSCAFSVHFAAVHEKETGHLLDSSHNFNRLLTESYMYTPSDQRNYITGAVEPCFERISNFYDKLHMEIVSVYFNRSAQAHADAIQTNSARKYRRTFQSSFDTPDTSKKAALFSSFLTLTLDPKTGMAPQIKTLSPEDFLLWLERQTPVNDPAHITEINRMQSEFDAMQKQLLQDPKNPVPDLLDPVTPAPGPSV